MRTHLGMAECCVLKVGNCDLFSPLSQSKTNVWSITRRQGTMDYLAILGCVVLSSGKNEFDKQTNVVCIVRMLFINPGGFEMMDISYINIHNLKNTMNIHDIAYGYKLTHEYS